MRCARLKLWSISGRVSQIGGVFGLLFTLQGEGYGLLELLQFLSEREISLRSYTLSRHCVGRWLLSRLAGIGLRDAHLGRAMGK